MKNKIFLAILLNLAVAGWPQELVVAVTDFTARSGYTDDELSDITELFAGFLRDTGAVRVVTRSQWEAILGEHRFQRGGLVSETEVRQLGQALGAQAVITGTLMRLGNNNVLNLSLLNIETGEMISAARSSFNSLDEFLNLLPSLARDIVKLLEKQNPLFGKWKVEGGNTILILNENGTFEINSCKWQDGTFDVNTKRNPPFHQRDREGIAKGNFSFSKGEISFVGVCSYESFRTTWNHNGTERIKFEGQFMGYLGRETNEKLTANITYSMPNNDTLIVGNFKLFQKRTYPDNGQVRRIYYNTLRRVN
jgi:TolB-like protein